MKTYFTGSVFADEKNHGILRVIINFLFNKKRNKNWWYSNLKTNKNYICFRGVGFVLYMCLEP
jgi:hypothetical protein